MKTVTPTARALHAALQQARRHWRQGYAGLVSARAALGAYGESLRARLPIPTTVGHAYSPRQNTGNGGGGHIIVQEPLAAGRLKREKGATLCGRSFWGLEEMPGRAADCLQCLEAAERLVGDE